MDASSETSEDELGEHEHHEGIESENNASLSAQSTSLSRCNSIFKFGMIQLLQQFTLINLNAI